MNKLTIEKDNNETVIKLDGLKLECIKEYKIKNSAKGLTELKITIDVK
ncbi:hypothetical protein [Clostridium sp.]|nr:hypothetical protein [Clostridium sp.]